jgi:hypothetical protein
MPMAVFTPIGTGLLVTAPTGSVTGMISRSMSVPRGAEAL